MFGGHEAVIMPGVQIGSGAIIAAQAVVTRNVPNYAIVGGNPAQIIRMRHDADTINRLLKIAWWDWEAAAITHHVKIINSINLNELERIAETFKSKL